MMLPALLEVSNERISFLIYLFTGSTEQHIENEVN